MSKRNYLFSIDFLRFSAFFCIYVFHFLSTVHMYNEAIPFELTPGKFSVPAVMVALFFLMSGYGLMKGKDAVFHTGEFYKKRVIRILIPYLFFTVIYILYKTFRTGSLSFMGEHPSYSLIFLLTGLSSWLNNYGLNAYDFAIGEWFIGVLLIMYLLFPLLRKLMLRFDTLFLLVYAAFYIVWFMFYPLNAAIYIDLFAKLFPFIIGMYLKIHPVRHQHFWSLIGLLIVLLTLFPLSIFRNIEIEFFISLNAAAIFLMVLPLNKLKKDSLPVKLISLPAACEYEMFLSHHIILLEGAACFAKALPSFGKKKLFLLFAALYLLTFLMGLLLHYGIESVSEFLHKKTSKAI